MLDLFSSQMDSRAKQVVKQGAMPRATAWSSFYAEQEGNHYLEEVEVCCLLEAGY